MGSELRGDRSPRVEPAPVPVNWDSSALRRFWDWERNFPEHYFTNKYGRSILQVLRRYLEPGQRVLDYGCGMGFLVAHLMRELKVNVWATDSNEYSVELTQERNEPHELFGGAVLTHQLPGLRVRFDRVVAVEVLEHLDGGRTATFFRRIVGVLKPDGLLLVTTPNRERLDRNQILCPNCNQMFHRWQHVRSVDRQTLIRLGEEFGFRLLDSIETDFARGGVSGYLSRRHPWADRNRRMARPHLVGVYARR